MAFSIGDSVYVDGVHVAWVVNIRPGMVAVRYNLPNVYSNQGVWVEEARVTPRDPRGVIRSFAGQGTYTGPKQFYNPASGYGGRRRRSRRNRRSSRRRTRRN
jgi:hypothetical protein